MCTLLKWSERALERGDFMCMVIGISERTHYSGWSNWDLWKDNNMSWADINETKYQNGHYFFVFIHTVQNVEQECWSHGWSSQWPCVLAVFSTCCVLSRSFAESNQEMFGLIITQGCASLLGNEKAGPEPAQVV